MFSQLATAMSDALYEFEQQYPQRRTVDRRPRRVARQGVCMRDDAKNVYLDVDLPGVKKEDIRLSIDDNILSISCERRHLEGNYLRQDARFGTLERSIPLPEDVQGEPSGIEAKCVEGVLHVTLPKQTVSPEEPEQHRIEVK